MKLSVAPLSSSALILELSCMDLIKIGALTWRSLGMNTASGKRALNMAACVGLSKNLFLGLSFLLPISRVVLHLTCWCVLLECERLLHHHSCHPFLLCRRF